MRKLDDAGSGRNENLPSEGTRGLRWVYIELTNRVPAVGQKSGKSRVETPLPELGKSWARVGCKTPLPGSKHPYNLLPNLNPE